MNIYVGNYDNNFGYLIRKDDKDIEKVKLSTEKEADELAKQGAKGAKEREDLIMFTVLREVNDLMDATSHIESDKRRIKPR